MNAELIDELVPVKSADVLRCSWGLAQKEGVVTGISGGVTLVGALRFCAKALEGSTGQKAV